MESGDDSGVHAHFLQGSFSQEISLTNVRMHVARDITKPFIL